MNDLSIGDGNDGDEPIVIGRARSQDRLLARSLVSRVESGEDRRVRIVALTPRGKDLIAPAFRKHAGQMRRVFSELSAEEIGGLEEALKKIGKRAVALMEEKGPRGKG